MKMRCLPISGSRGFTLIELIVTITLVAIMAAMCIQLMGNCLFASIRQINTLNNSMALYQVMEAMVADYNNQMVTSTTPVSTFSSRVASNAGNYGTYTLVENSCVTYSAGTESTTSCGTTGAQTLKVKITNGVITLTMLFTQ